MSSSTFNAADGDGYERQMGRWSRRLAPPFIAFTEVSGPTRILDVGCGTGSLSLALAADPAIRRIHGVDLAQVYVDYARARSADPRLSFDVADACALPFADAAFDHALSLLVVQFIPDGLGALREMRRVTRPGGTVAAATWDTRGGFVAYRMVFDTAAMLFPSGEATRARMYTRPMSRPGELARAFEAAGLSGINSSMLTIRMDFADFADFWAPAEGQDGPIAAYVRTLDPRDHARLRDAVRRAYLDGDPDGPRSYAATAWTVKGTVPA